jgi:hypothetical protein
LRTGRLHVAFRSAQDRKDDRLLSDQEMRAVELGIQVNDQIEIAHALIAEISVRQRNREIAAKANKHFRPTVDHRLHGLDGVMAVMRGRPLQITRATGDCGVDGVNSVRDPEPERPAWLVLVPWRLVWPRA